MPTTVHIPGRLLERVDARAKVLGVSRNRLIIEALEEKLAAHGGWPAEFVEMLTKPLDPELAQATRDMEKAIRRNRRSRRRAPRL